MRRGRLVMTVAVLLVMSVVGAGTTCWLNDSNDSLDGNRTIFKATDDNLVVYTGDGEMVFGHSDKKDYYRLDDASILCLVVSGRVWKVIDGVVKKTESTQDAIDTDYLTIVNKTPTWKQGE